MKVGGDAGASDDTLVHANIEPVRGRNLPHHRHRPLCELGQLDGLVTSLDLMTPEEEQYYTRRKYDDRRVYQEEVPPATSEAIVTKK